jgi:hypothetical protein
MRRLRCYMRRNGRAFTSVAVPKALVTRLQLGPFTFLQHSLQPSPRQKRLIAITSPPLCLMPPRPVCRVVTLLYDTTDPHIWLPSSLEGAPFGSWELDLDAFSLRTKQGHKCMYQSISWGVLRQIACNKHHARRAIHLVGPQGMGRPTRTRELSTPKGERAVHGIAKNAGSKQRMLAEAANRPDFGSGIFSLD